MAERNTFGGIVRVVTDPLRALDSAAVRGAAMNADTARSQHEEQLKRVDQQLEIWQHKRGNPRNFPR
jgi:hypothetical protein